MRVEHIGDATLYLADCREVLPALGRVDAVVTDPPYGVSAGVGSGLRRGDRKRKSNYSTFFFEDNAEYVEHVVVPAIKDALGLANRGALTSGLRHMRLYPLPDHVGIFQFPNSVVMSSWGPMCWQPILYYGSDPHFGHLRPDSRLNCNDTDRETEHPCPKPLKQWTWLVERATLPEELVLDPFAGSGTTGVACAALGRRFVGIEIEPRYFDIACLRIEEAYRQPRLFEEPPAPKVVQPSMFEP